MNRSAFCLKFTMNFGSRIYRKQDVFVKHKCPARVANFIDSHAFEKKVKW
jgi:hypothetical protein